MNIPDIIFEIVKYSSSKKDLMLVSKTWLEVITMRLKSGLWYLISCSNYENTPRFIINIRIRNINNNWAEFIGFNFRVYDWSLIKKIDICICSADIFCTDNCESLTVYCNCINKGHYAEVLSGSSFKNLRKMIFEGIHLEHKKDKTIKTLNYVLSESKNLKYLVLSSIVNVDLVVRHGFVVCKSNRLNTTYKKH